MIDIKYVITCPFSACNDMTQGHIKVEPIIKCCLGVHKMSFIIFLVSFGWVLWHINQCRLFNAKSCLYIYIYIYIKCI